MADIAPNNRAKKDIASKKNFKKIETYYVYFFISMYAWNAQFPMRVYDATSVLRTILLRKGRRGNRKKERQKQIKEGKNKGELKN